jgi:glycosyltransferase involved in cell wall biosynthesis
MHKTQTMNIAIITPLVPTYSETFISLHLQQLPFKVHHFHSLPKMGYHPIYDGAGKPLSSDRKWVNYIETGIDRVFGENGTGYFFRQQAMLRYFKKHQIQAVLAEYGPVGASVMEVCAKAGIPLLVHFHGRDAYHFKTLERYKKHYPKMFQLAHTIFPVSTDMQEQLLGLGAPAEKLVLNPYGPNSVLFHYQDHADAEPVFLSVGRFTGKKAPDLTIKAFQLTLRQVPNARLIMVGDGPLWESCKQLALSLGIADHIVFAGSRPPAAIAELHHQVRVFVQHSIRAADGDSEGTPVAILEAMQSGLPVVSTRHAGIKDVVLEGITGFLVEEGDYKGMSKYMITLAKNAALSAEMGKQGANRIQEHYTLAQHLDRLSQRIEKAVLDFRES